MKIKITTFLMISLMLFSCSVKKELVTESNLYEIMYHDEYAGNSFKFYEIISKESEFKMLLNDKKLKKKIKPIDIETSNFLLLNMGEKNSGGYTIGIESVEETSTNIFVTIKETKPKSGENVTMAMTYPMCIVKINSKKNIIFNEITNEQKP